MKVSSPLKLRFGKYVKWKLFSKDKVAYNYLSESASIFPYGKKLNNILQKIGFINVENRPQTFGVATIYTATKSI